jgi:hypothetical protein
MTTALSDNSRMAKRPWKWWPPCLLFAIFTLLCLGIVPMHRGVRNLISSLPLDEASAHAVRVGECRESETPSPDFDLVEYLFDGTTGKKAPEVVGQAVAAVRWAGLKSKKPMTLIVCRDLKPRDKSHKTVYPFGIYLKTTAIRAWFAPDLAKAPLIQSPMNWDRRINEWIYSTNNDRAGDPVIAENPGYKNAAPASIDGSWFFKVQGVKQRAELEAKFGKAKYFVNEYGSYSEVYPVEDKKANQIGTVRAWYDAKYKDYILRAGCYLTNK